MARRKTTGPTLQGSRRAKQIAVVMLEALSGQLGTTEAASALGISMSRYYQLETRALHGLIQALEPRARGPQKTKAGEIAALKAEKAALEKELRRHQALLRAAQRSVGLPAAALKKASSKKPARKRKRGSRGETVLATLRREVEGREENDGEEQRSETTGGVDRDGERARA